MNKYLLREVFSDDAAMLSVFEQQEHTALLSKLLDEKNVGEETALAPNKRKIGILKELLKLREQMLEAELVSLIEPLIPPLIPAPLPGSDGRDGRDGVDGRDGRDGVDGELGAPGKDGKDGVNGKDGTLELNDVYDDFIKRIAKDKPIDISNIRNAESFMFGKKKYKTEELLHGGGPTLVAGSGITLTSNTNGTTTVTATGTGFTISQETPVGLVNASNTTYTVSHTPIFIMVDGMLRTAGNGYTYVPFTISVDPLTPPVQSIISFYLA